MVHPKLLNYRNADLSKVQDLAAVERELTDVEHDLEILKQRLPPKLRANFDNISVDKKELDALKQKAQAEKQRPAQPQPQPPPRPRRQPQPRP